MDLVDQGLEVEKLVDQGLEVEKVPLVCAGLSCILCLVPDGKTVYFRIEL